MGEGALLTKNETITTLAFLGIALAAASPAEAQPTPCVPDGIPPIITLTPADPAVVYDQSHSSAEITGVSADRVGGRTLGMTVATFTSILKVNFRIHPVPGGVCMEVNELNVTLGYETTVVYIGNDWPQGSCQYAAVLEHEDKHVGINRGTFAQYLPYYRSALAEAATNPGFPYFALDKATGAAVLSDYLDKILDAATAEMVRRRDQLNALLDSPESYAYTRNECPRW